MRRPPPGFLNILIYLKLWRFKTISKKPKEKRTPLLSVCNISVAGDPIEDKERYPLIN